MIASFASSSCLRSHFIISLLFALGVFNWFPVCIYKSQGTAGWTSVNLLHLPGSTEIAYLEGLTKKLTNQNGHWHGDARFLWLEDNEFSLLLRHCLFLTCSYRDNQFLHAMQRLRPVLKHN